MISHILDIFCLTKVEQLKRFLDIYLDGIKKLKCKNNNK